MRKFEIDNAAWKYVGHCVFKCENKKRGNRRIIRIDNKNDLELFLNNVLIAFYSFVIL